MRQPSLRQIEALMSVVETGSVSRAAEMMRISQPAASKLIAHLEDDTEMQLFDRAGGRLVPTQRGMRLYEEANRIFGSVNQLTRAVEAIRREDKGQILIGIIPGLSGGFIRRAICAFHERHPDVFISVEARSSHLLADWLISGRLDVGILVTRVEHATITTAAMNNRPMVCLLPLGHRLCSRKTITPKDLAGEPFISFGSSSLTRRRVDALFEAEGLRPSVVLEATTAPNVCEFVASGLGVTVIDPTFAETVVGRVEVIPFDPPTVFEFYVSHPAHGRNSLLVEAFIEEARNALETGPAQLKLRDSKAKSPPPS